MLFEWKSNAEAPQQNRLIKYMEFVTTTRDKRQKKLSPTRKKAHTSRRERTAKKIECIQFFGSTKVPSRWSPKPSSSAQNEGTMKLSKASKEKKPLHLRLLKCYFCLQCKKIALQCKFLALKTTRFWVANFPSWRMEMQAVGWFVSVVMNLLCWLHGKPSLQQCGWCRSSAKRCFGSSCKCVHRQSFLQYSKHTHRHSASVFQWSSDSGSDISLKKTS